MITKFIKEYSQVDIVELAEKTNIKHTLPVGSFVEVVGLILFTAFSGQQYVFMRFTTGYEDYDIPLSKLLYSVHANPKETAERLIEQGLVFVQDYDPLSRRYLLD